MKEVFCGIFIIGLALIVSGLYCANFTVACIGFVDLVITSFIIVHLDKKL